MPVLAFFFLLGTSFECQKSKAGLPAPVEASAWSPVQPVLKGLAANPVVRVAVSVPQGNGTQQFRSLQLSLDPAALELLQKLDIYRTGAEPFSASNMITSVVPNRENTEIPLSLSLSPGLHFIWISAVLKSDAEPGKKIEIRANHLKDATGKELLISQGSSSYRKYTGTVVRKAGDDNVHTYRIPGIITTDKGTLLAVYDIRYKNTADLPGNIDVGLSRSTDGGKSWQPMRVIMDMGTPHENNGVGDPAILFDPVTKKIFVAALWSKGNRSIAGSLPGLSPDTTGQFVLVESRDDGLTWSAPYTITPQVKNPGWHLFFNGPGNGIAMQDGKLVFAAQYWNENKMPYSTIIYSDDHGQSWKGGINGPRYNTTESQVVETSPGVLMLNMRDNRGAYRSIATTGNMGATWTEHATSYNALQDPVCMASLIRARVTVGGNQKNVLFFSNPNTSSGRLHITIKASTDMGESWPLQQQLEIDERQSYGYSSLTQMDDKHIGILYEGIRDLYFVKIPVVDLIK